MKRGATVLNFVLIIGMLMVSMILVLNLQKIALFQSRQVELDVSTEFVKEIVAIIENAQAYPTDLTKTIALPFIREYDFEVSSRSISVYFPREKTTMTEPFATSNLNILPSSFSNSGKIYLYGENRNLLITNKITCNLTDQICDPGCLFGEFDTQCDPECYTSYTKDICSSACLDTNHDGTINGKDADEICDPDCYNNLKNGGYYDIDCIESDDGICDPDTNNLRDGICDEDCKTRGMICDPDCGAGDQDCPSLSNDGICDLARGENCMTGKDCSCGECCVSCDNTDEKGCCMDDLISCNGKCVTPRTRMEGDICFCDSECVSQNCAKSAGQSDELHCCPSGMVWDGNDKKCIPSMVYVVALVPASYSDLGTTWLSRANHIKWFIEQTLPLKEEPYSLKVLIDDKNCPVSDEKDSASLLQCGNDLAVANGYPGADMTGGIFGVCVHDVVDDGCGGVLGFAIPGSGWFVAGYDTCTSYGCPSVQDSVTASHEIGHSFRLCEGYCYYGGGSCYESERSSFGGYCGTSRIEQKYPGALSGCSQCTGPSPCCDGRQLTGDPINPVDGGRDIMGPAQDLTARDFACDSYLAFKDVAISYGFDLQAISQAEIDECNSHISGDIP